jgi:hypothetical protein
MTDHEREIENLQLLIDALRDELTERINMCDMRSEKILELTDERDEARREVCAWQSGHSGKSFQDTAKIRGWDCFETKEREEAMDRLTQLDEELGL